ncbi:MAG: mechanosensitive ion channel family protein [Salinisphaeraceae bacterium]|nr:mechanosensitive ion channel family protein [Salinisphaeraceae bacterium]
MDWAPLNAALQWAGGYPLQVIASLIALVLYVLMVRMAFPKIEKGIEKGKFKSSAAPKALMTVRIFSAIITLAALMIIWGFDFSGLLLITTSIITLTGIALFASWSILSNVTAYVVLLLHKSYRRGNFVRVFDMDNYIEGYIAEVNVFNTRLITEAREVVIYPNNLLISRPTVINPRNRLHGVGKITDAKEPPTIAPAAANQPEE